MDKAPEATVRRTPGFRAGRRGRPGLRLDRRGRLLSVVRRLQIRFQLGLDAGQPHLLRRSTRGIEREIICCNSKRRVGQTDQNPGSESQGARLPVK